MRSIALLTVAVAAANALRGGQSRHDSSQQTFVGSSKAEDHGDMYLIETEPGHAIWVAEEQKWDLKRVCWLSLE